VEPVLYAEVVYTAFLRSGLGHLEEIMFVAALKIIALPAFFVLPWILLRVTEEDQLIQQLFVDRPLIGIFSLVPGFVIAAGWLFRAIKR
jgi:hypothetical protein